MNPTDFICLEKIHDCSIMIRGLELDKDFYSKDFELEQFRYIDTVTINLITCYDSKENEVSSEYLVCDHTRQHIDITEYTFPHDGLYKISHLIVPTYLWVEEYKKTFKEDPTVLYPLVYVYDNGNIYKYLDGKYSLVKFEELFEVNAFSGVSFTRTELFTFSICQLEECFINTYKEFLNLVCPSDKCNTDIDVRTRDLIWMGLHTIKYYINLGRYFDAQRLLEILEHCNGVCPNNLLNKSIGGIGCGCNKKS